MNKQSNLYTVIYITILVLVVGAALAFTAVSLRPMQQANAKVDKMKQILAAVHIATDNGDVAKIFDSHITELLLVDTEGNVIKHGNADDSAIFDLNIANESKAEPADRKLPVYVCSTTDGTKHIIPLAGSGLWGPIWGYVAIDDNGTTIYGAYFSHEGETPGLGAEIEKPAFQDQFVGRKMFVGDKFLPVTVVKAGQHPTNGADYVDGISGGTITSKGVGAMLDNCLAPYAKYLETLKNK